MIGLLKKVTIKFPVMRVPANDTAEFISDEIPPDGYTLISAQCIGTGDQNVLLRIFPNGNQYRVGVINIGNTSRDAYPTVAYVFVKSTFVI